MKQLKNGYYQVDQELDKWTANGIGYVTIDNIGAEIYEFGGGSAFEFIPHKQNPGGDKAYEITSNYFQDIANDGTNEKYDRTKENAKKLELKQADWI